MHDFSILAEHWLFGVFASCVLAIMFWPVKHAWNKAKATAVLAEQIHAKLSNAVDNHLHTIQDNTSETNTLLRTHTEKTGELLREQNGDVRELIGYLRGRL